MIMKKYYDCNKASYNHIWSWHSSNQGKQSKCPLCWFTAPFTKLGHPVRSGPLGHVQPRYHSIPKHGLKSCPSLILLHFKASLRSTFRTLDKEPKNWLCPSLAHLTLGTWTSMFSCIKWASRPVNQRSFLLQISWILKRSQYRVDSKKWLNHSSSFTNLHTKYVHLFRNSPPMPHSVPQEQPGTSYCLSLPPRQGAFWSLLHHKSSVLWALKAWTPDSARPEFKSQISSFLSLDNFANPYIS